MEIKVTSGNVRLDFTEAVISQPLLEINAEVRSGNLVITTKPGIAVDTDVISESGAAGQPHGMNNLAGVGTATGTALPIAA